MKTLVASLTLAGVLSAVPVLSEVTAGRDINGNIWFAGLTPHSSYEMPYSGALFTKQVRANECGVLKVADSPTTKVADYYKVEGVQYDTWENEVTSPPKCTQGVLSPATLPPHFFVMRIVNTGSGVNSATHGYYDWYKTGLTPFMTYEVSYTGNPTIYHKGKSNACGILVFNKNKTTRNFTFGAEDYVALHLGPFNQPYPLDLASDLPVKSAPICRNGIVYNVN